MHGFWVGEWLKAKSDVHRVVIVESVMRLIADGTLAVREGGDLLSKHVLTPVVHHALPLRWRSAQWNVIDFQANCMRR